MLREKESFCGGFMYSFFSTQISYMSQKILTELVLILAELVLILVDSVAQWFGASVKDDHDSKVNGSNPNLVSLDKMLHDDYLCLVESGKQQKKSEANFNRKTRMQMHVLSESGFVVSIALPPLSRDRRIKMKKSLN